MRFQALLIVAALSVLPACGRDASSQSGRNSPDEVERRSSREHVVISRAPRGDVMAAGRTVRFATAVDGDVAAAGSEVAIAAPVRGYVMAAGSDVRIDGAVDDDVWAAGATVNVNAPVGDNLWAAGRSVTIEPGGATDGNAMLAGNTVDVKGRVGRDVRVAAASVTLDSEVAGSVRATAGRVRLGPGAVIGGDLIVSGPNEPEIDADARVLGRIVHDPASGRDGGVGGWLIWWGWLFVALFALAAVVMAVSRRWMARVDERLAHRTGLSVLTGVVAFVLGPLIVVLLAATIVGIPLALVLLALYVAAVALSGAFVSYRVGEWLPVRRQQAEMSYGRLAAGALLVSFLTALPWAGWLVGLAVVCAGVGALVLERQEARRAAALA
jgi:MFS family permease